jgi:putative ABC transport system ATP-binding protein
LPPNGFAARCADLVKTYVTPSAAVEALKGIDAHFEWGKVTAVVGPSGSGKSSLLRILAGLDHPTSGSVIVDGRDLSQATAADLRALRRDRVGYVFQRPSDNFVAHLTLDQHMHLAMSLSPDSELDALVVTKHLGIDHRLAHLPYELSGGELQRGAFAQVRVGGAKIVIADEPTAELDSGSSTRVLEIVHGLADEGAAVVIATHDPSAIERADVVIELEHGSIASAKSHRPLPHVPPRVAPTPEHRYPRVREQPVSVRRRPLVAARAISKFYTRGEEEVHAIDRVSLDISTGEIAGLVGRSGSGKTTLLNVLAGWESPDSGELVWPGFSERPFLWHDLGLVPQTLGLIEEFTVAKNIEYPARLSGELPEIGDRIESLLEALGLQDLAERLPRETSIGERQRTALARALVLSPRLLLADEPTGHQDRIWSRRVMEAIKQAAASGTTCLIATHNEELTSYMDKVFRMSDGRLRPPSSE